MKNKKGGRINIHSCGTWWVQRIVGLGRTQESELERWDGGVAKKRKLEIEIMENEKLSWDGGQDHLSGYNNH